MLLFFKIIKMFFIFINIKIIKNILVFVTEFVHCWAELWPVPTRAQRPPTDREFRPRSVGGLSAVCRPSAHDLANSAYE